MSVTLRWSTGSCSFNVFFIKNLPVLYFFSSLFSVVLFPPNIFVGEIICKWFINIISIFATLYICSFASKARSSFTCNFHKFHNFQFEYSFFDKKSALDSSYTYFVTFSQNSFYFVVFSFSFFKLNYYTLVLIFKIFMFLFLLYVQVIFIFLLQFWAWKIVYIVTGHRQKNYLNS